MVARLFPVAWARRTTGAIMLAGAISLAVGMAALAGCGARPGLMVKRVDPMTDGVFHLLNGFDMAAEEPIAAGHTPGWPQFAWTEGGDHLIVSVSVVDTGLSGTVLIDLDSAPLFLRADRHPGIVLEPIHGRDTHRHWVTTGPGAVRSVAARVTYRMPMALFCTWATGNEVRYRFGLNMPVMVATARGKRQLRAFATRLGCWGPTETRTRTPPLPQTDDPEADDNTSPLPDL